MRTATTEQDRKGEKTLKGKFPLERGKRLFSPFNTPESIKKRKGKKDIGEKWIFHLLTYWNH